MRALATTRGYLANNDIGAFGVFVNRVTASGERGGLLRLAKLPENWIVANPQFGRGKRDR